MIIEINHLHACRIDIFNFYIYIYTLNDSMFVIKVKFLFAEPLKIIKTECVMWVYSSIESKTFFIVVEFKINFINSSKIENVNWDENKTIGFL